MPSYHPILKWRERELSALGRLTTSDRENIRPIFELPPAPWDFDAGRPLDAQVSRYRNFGARLAEAWGNRRCAIDAPHESGTGSGLPSVVLDTVFYQARINGCIASPVVGVDRSDAYLRAAGRIARIDGHGLSIRIRQSQFDATLDARLRETLVNVGADPTQCDILVDFEANSMHSSTSFAESACEAIFQLPFIEAWRSLVLCSTAMPAALPFDMYWPVGPITRHDWTGYLLAANLLKQQGLDLQFADYGVQHPNSEMVDPRLIGRDLALVYATNDIWQVYASPSADSSAIREIALQWRSDVFRRSRQSPARELDCWADAQIALSCDVEITAQELALWPQISTNRHLSVVSRQAKAAAMGAFCQLSGARAASSLSNFNGLRSLATATREY